MTGIATRTLGRTGLEVTMLGFGALELRGALHGREVSPEHAERVLNTILDSGINFIDTSIDYGQSEDFIGRYISHRRSEYFLATKCGCVVGEIPDRETAPFSHTFTRENIIAGVEQSLARMKTDYIDLLQLHAHPSKETLEENGSIETMLDLQQQGKIRFIGMSSTLPHLLDHIQMGIFDAFQIPYSALQREHEEVITQAAHAGAGIIIRGQSGAGLGSNPGRHGPHGVHPALHLLTSQPPYEHRRNPRYPAPAGQLEHPGQGSPSAGPVRRGETSIG